MAKKNGPVTRQSGPDEDDGLQEMASGDDSAEEVKKTKTPPAPALPQEPQELYIMKYRRGMTGVSTGFIKASSQRNAELVGNRYCDSIPGCKYITVTRAVIADESILTPEGAEKLRELVHAGV